MLLEFVLRFDFPLAQLSHDLPLARKVIEAKQMETAKKRETEIDTV